MLAGSHPNPHAGDNQVLVYALAIVLLPLIAWLGIFMIRHPERYVRESKFWRPPGRFEVAWAAVLGWVFLGGSIAIGIGVVASLAH